MAHEITAQDSLALFQSPAWHGLGTVVSSAMSPDEALIKAGLDWKLVFPRALTATFEDGTELKVDKTRPLYRAPHNSNEDYIELHHFGQGYVPIQNSDIAELAYTFGDSVKVESAGSIMQGRRVWFLLRGETMDIQGDAMNTYMALVNGNDGQLCFGVMPTSVRIVCNNTLNMAITNARGRMFRIAHSGNYKARMEECARALKQFHTVEAAFAAQAESLASKKIKAEKEAVAFWQKIYTDLYGAPDTEKKQDEAKEMVSTWDNIMKAEMLQLGIDTPSYWLMANAVTNNIQHREPTRETEGWQERRLNSNLFEGNMNLCANVMRTALTF